MPTSDRKLSVRLREHHGEHCQAKFEQMIEDAIELEESQVFTQWKFEIGDELAHTSADAFQEFTRYVVLERVLVDKGGTLVKRYECREINTRNLCGIGSLVQVDEREMQLAPSE